VQFTLPKIQAGAGDMPDANQFHSPPNPARAAVARHDFMDRERLGRSERLTKLFTKSPTRAYAGLLLALLFFVGLNITAAKLILNCYFSVRLLAFSLVTGLSQAFFLGQLVNIIHLRRIRYEKKQIARLNHFVRNALQAIYLCIHTPLERKCAFIIEVAVKTIDVALQALSRALGSH
jgi:hypothetical protein